MNSLDELAPVDFVVLAFPAGTRDFSGEVARELASLVDAEMVRVLDILILDKDADGNVEVVEIADLGHRDDLRRVEAGLSEVLAASDLDAVSASVVPGTTAGVVVYENVWASHLVEAARSSGGDLVATGSIPGDRVAASLANRTDRRRT